MKQPVKPLPKSCERGAAMDTPFTNDPPTLADIELLAALRR